MRKRIILIGAFMLFFGGCQFGDELVAFSSGTPIRLVSASGSLDAYDSNKQPLSPFFHLFDESGDLRLVVRSYFYRSGPLSRPYLTVDSEGRGLVHIDTKAQFTLFSTKCEFLRQFEVKINAKDLKDLKSLQIYNHDVDDTASPVVKLSDLEFMSALKRKSSEHLALQDLSGVAGGC
jgi:hypothetical protein